MFYCWRERDETTKLQCNICNDAWRSAVDGSGFLGKPDLKTEDHNSLRIKKHMKYEGTS